MNFNGLFKDHFVLDALHNINVSFLVAPPKEAYGGCAGNIAFNLALLSTPSEILESVGTDFSQYERWLFERGIATDLLQRCDDVPTASAYIMTDTADNQITAFSEGASARPYTTADITPTTFALAILGTNSIETSRIVASAFRTAAVPYLFDPSQKITAFDGESLRECIAGATGLFANDYELKMMIQKTQWSEQEIREQVSFMIVTEGAQGSRIITREKEERVSAVAVEKVLDPTGAGDAYRAGFIAGYVKGLPLPTCAKIASTVAAFNVECYGTQNHTFTTDDLQARYHANYQESFPL